jgi:hypothetical protein
VAVVLQWSVVGDACRAGETGEQRLGPRDIRRRCERRLADLNIPSPLDMAELRAEVSRKTGRPIEVRVVDMPSRGPCGLWVSIGNTDLVYVAAGTSVDHQRQVELHELSHILAGHGAVPVPVAGVMQLVPDLDPHLVERMLGRTFYSDEAEYEAELQATMIGCAGTDWAPEPRRTVLEADIEIVKRIDRDLSKWS